MDSILIRTTRLFRPMVELLSTEYARLVTRRILMLFALSPNAITAYFRWLLWFIEELKKRRNYLSRTNTCVQMNQEKVNIWTTIAGKICTFSLHFLCNSLPSSTNNSVRMFWNLQKIHHMCLILMLFHAFISCPSWIDLSWFDSKPVFFFTDQLLIWIKFDIVTSWIHESSRNMTQVEINCDIANNDIARTSRPEMPMYVWLMMKFEEKRHQLLSFWNTTLS